MKKETLKKIGCITILSLIAIFAALDILLIYSDLCNNPKIGLKAYSILKMFSFSS